MSGVQDASNPCQVIGRRWLRPITCHLKPAQKEVQMTWRGKRVGALEGSRAVGRVCSSSQRCTYAAGLFNVSTGSHQKNAKYITNISTGTKSPPRLHLHLHQPFPPPSAYWVVRVDRLTPYVTSGSGANANANANANADASASVSRGHLGSTGVSTVNRFMYSQAWLVV